MKRIPPLAPITLELRKRLGEIIAERPPQEIASKASGRLGEIIEERIAGLPPEQRIEVAQLTILEILLTTPSALATPPRPEVPLTGLLRRHVALELARLWTRSGWAKIERQRELMHIELYIPSPSWREKTNTGRKRRKRGILCRRGSRGPSPKRRASERGGASEPSSKRDSSDPRSTSSPTMSGSHPRHCELS